ncbi:MAG: hypothetical protein OXE46_05420 [Chloroflexi bacterium]|nr:hypothetical protein [Chloroflexota bacterium]
MKTAICLLVLLLVLAMPALAHEEDLGSFKYPIPLGDGAVVAGMVVSVIDIARPLDDAKPMSTYPNQESVEISLDIHCQSDRQVDCQLEPYDFAVAGELGLIYENASIESHQLGPGATTQIVVTALIDRPDSSLLLLYSHFGVTPYTYPLVFATEAARISQQSIEITAAVGMLARVGPSSELDFSGVFGRGEALMAQGRNANGSWLEIAFGWVPVERIETAGDIMSLPVTG